MTVYFLAFTIAMAAALAATPVARRAAIRLDIVDHPGGRKAHRSPVPYLGGVAIYVAFIAILLLGRSALFEGAGMAKATGQLLAIVGGASLMAVLGLLDDRFDLPAPVKLGGQLLGAIILVVAHVTIHFNHREFAPLEAPLTVLWVVGITNALNLMDNMDGLAVGTAGIAACFFFLHAILSLPIQNLVASLAAALAGACFGFLYYNWNPARIFMGDAGALFLGYLLAALALKLTLAPVNPTVYHLAGYTPATIQGLHAIALLAPLFVLGVPIFDTTLVTISRRRRGIPVSRGGRDHLSHRLVGAGLSHREAVMVIYLACCALGGVSIMLTRSSLAEGVVIAAASLACAAALFVRLERMFAAQVRLHDAQGQAGVAP